MGLRELNPRACGCMELRLTSMRDVTERDGGYEVGLKSTAYGDREIDRVTQARVKLYVSLVCNRT